MLLSTLSAYFPSRVCCLHDETLSSRGEDAFSSLLTSPLFLLDLSSLIINYKTILDSLII